MLANYTKATARVAGRAEEVTVNTAPLRCFVVLTSSVLAFACAEDASNRVQTVQQTAHADEARVVLCHQSEEDGEPPHTIAVSASAVDAHLGHGDYHGECGACEVACEELAGRVLDFCQGFPLFPGLPPDFCETSAQVVFDQCGGSCPTPAPEVCDAFCASLSDDAHGACLSLVPVPFLCDVGASQVYDACRDVFECPPPPPPCDQACLDHANAMLEGCIADPPRRLICPDALDPVVQTCLADAQGFLNDCLFGDDGCFPPAGDCGMDCNVLLTDAYLTCIDEPSCGDPNACAAEADAAGADCFDGCCVDDCIRYDCEPACGDDPACLDQCATDHCQSVCSPPPCDFVCPNGACVPDPSFCPPDPPCEFVCPNGACVPDPSFCGDPLCEDQCFIALDECHASGQDPLFCDQELRACLEGCYPPPPCEFVCPDGACVPDPSFCWEPPPCDGVICPNGACVPDPSFCGEPSCDEFCFFAFEDCMAAGLDPAFCEADLNLCLEGCYPPPPCEFVCPDGTCVPDPSFCWEPPPCDGVICPDGACVPDPTFCREPPPCEFVCPDGTCVPDPTLCGDPACEESCFFAFEDCMAGGIDPAFCEVDLNVCLEACYPPPPPCDGFLCPDGACVADPGFCPPPPPPCDGFLCPDGACVADPGACAFCDPAFEIAGCHTECVPAELYANGVCDPMFDCPELGFDGGDCPG